MNVLKCRKNSSKSNSHLKKFEIESCCQCKDFDSGLH